MSRATRDPAIVLVDDDPVSLMLLYRAVLDLLIRERLDLYDIFPFTSGAEALALMMQRAVPLLITNQALPGMDGLQLTAKAKEVSPTTRVVVVSAHELDELEQRAREAGADHYSPKPASAKHLEQRAREAGADDYLLKPLSEDRLQQILRETLQYKGSNQPMPH